MKLKIFTTQTLITEAHNAEPALNKKIQAWAKDQGIIEYTILNGTITHLPMSLGTVPYAVISIFVHYA